MNRPETSLPRSTPSAAGVDARGITEFLDALAAAPDVELHTVLVVKGGSVVAEKWRAPYSPERPHLLYSLSKSFTSTALGLAIAEGLVDLDATVLSYFPELDADVTDERARSIRVRHVAAMASGHEEDAIGPASLDETGDLLRGFLMIPPDVEPGTLFTYNQPCTFALAAIVQRVSGTGMLEFLRPRLFDPLGVGDLGWIEDGLGREIGFSGLHATTETVAKLGQLYLQRGAWEGEQLLPAEWVDAATRTQVPTDNQPEDKPDWRQGYGFQFWTARHGYRGDGAYGQYCVVLPEADAVVAITSQSPDMQAVLDAVWAHLLPALTAGSVDETADEALAQRLAEPELPGPDGTPGLPPEGEFRTVPGNEPPYLTRVSVAGSRITLVEDGVALTTGLAPDGWQVDDALATRSARREDGGAAVDIIFVETPHRLHLVLDPAAGTFWSRWATAPLHTTPLTALRMPRN